MIIGVTQFDEHSLQNIQNRDASVTGELRDLLLKQLLSPLAIAAGALDLSFNLAIFTLGLFTRSLASIYYMINYKPVDVIHYDVLTGEEDVYCQQPPVKG